MTNILAAIIVTVSTNWTSIGEFIPTKGTPQYDVQEAHLQTNTIAILEWKGEKREFTLESVQGPKIDERRTEKCLPPWNWNQIQPGYGIG
jgi:hypothetical protein